MFLRRKPMRGFLLAVLHAVLCWSAVARAEAPRVLPTDELPNDRRLGPQVNLRDNYFPMHVPDSIEAWQHRSQWLRRQVLVAMGLWPMPIKTPNEAVIHGKMDQGDYTIEKVYFESFPNHFVTGNLYRPKTNGRAHPAVLCPHGHWAGGRFYDAGLKQVRQQITQGAERFENGGRSHMQARCVQLARMGCVVFHNDMVGYADSQQIEHRPGVRPEMNTSRDWGYFSPQAELRLQNMMGLQTYNSIRALDFLSGLPDVDAERIAVTGASGGGTQTFILCAIDPRPAVSFPAVMVSTAMQGGCTCENACYLRVGTGNIELAALFAPKPLGMTGANDWTSEIATKGLPALRKLYGMFDATDHVSATPLVHFGHNYNYVSRAVMYRWLNQHLGLGLAEPIVEEDYQRQDQRQLTVWDKQHPAPPSGETHERLLLRWLTLESELQLVSQTPTDKASLAEYRRVVGGGWEAIIGRRLASGAKIQYVKIGEREREGFLEFPALLRYAAAGEELPTVFLYPHEWNGDVVIWIHEAGKAGLYASSGKPRPEVKRLLDGGFAVAGVDLLYQGEFLRGGRPLAKARLVNPEPTGRNAYAGYTFGYNHPLFAERVHDILSVVAFVRDDAHATKRVHLIGLGGSGPLVAAAASQAGDALEQVVVDTEGFRFASLNEFDDPRFLPGSVKYGDLPGALSLIAPNKLWLSGEAEGVPPLVAAAYRAAGAGDNITLFDGATGEKANAAITWIMETPAEGD